MISPYDEYQRQTSHVITPEEWELHLCEGLWIPQCTVLTKKNTWCKNPIFYGQIHTYEGENNTPVVGMKYWAVIEAGMCATHARLAQPA